jgi:hypothetical protein
MKCDLVKVQGIKFQQKSEVYEMPGKVYLWTYASQALLWISAVGHECLTTFGGLSYEFQQYLQTGYTRIWYT